MLCILDCALTVSLNTEKHLQPKTIRKTALQTSTKLGVGSGTYQHRIIQQDLLHKKQMTDRS